ncbi:MAG: GNAT family N-acetyltransferase [Candidatus Marinimicrobia bacterium]|nr:GNAT family N-acetyltransferase [Candidatus Neomarinimicrobiota bacterium]MBL7066999.1 GNAT family N-acetyltransferase [Candidatus Neomarinimicrobiota bacterium]
MDKNTRNLFEVSLSETQSRVLASTPDGISIELVEHLGEAEYGKIVKISETLVDNFGSNARFNRSSIKKYFNYPKTLPFVIRYKDDIEGFIVGSPIENFAKEDWAHYDDNLGKGNTIYTYAYVVKKDKRNIGIAKMLKRVYQNTLRRKGYLYMSGHVMEGVSLHFTKKSHVVRKFDNWNNTGYAFEYYRFPL